MTKTKNILVVAVLLVVMAIVAFGFLNKKKESAENPPGVPVTIPSEPNSESGNPTINGTQSPAPENIVVPETDSTNVPKNVAKPSEVYSVTPDSSAKLRVFEIKAEGGKFTPDTIIVKVGDLVRIEFTAVDKSYDFTQPNYGIRPAVTEKGKTRIINFQASGLGDFTFFCSLCGGPEKGPVGHLMVVKN